jgi:hypothetical protein
MRARLNLNFNGDPELAGNQGSAHPQTALPKEPAHFRSKQSICVCRSEFNKIYLSFDLFDIIVSLIEKGRIRFCSLTEM